MRGHVQSGFTLVELLMVIAVIAVLTVIVAIGIPNYREGVYYSRANTEFTVFSNGLKLYAAKYNDFPADVSRGLPSALNEFIAKTDQSSVWPNGPWPSSVYDYDRWDITSGASTVDTIQISIRFCPIGGPLSACKFPNQSWAKTFQVDSALYYCIKGLCRSHQSQPATYPGYCVNCPGNKAIGT